MINFVHVHRLPIVQAKFKPSIMNEMSRKGLELSENALGPPFFSWENYICSQKKGDQSAI
jgi:hypothetical protein